MVTLGNRVLLEQHIKSGQKRMECTNYIKRSDICLPLVLAPESIIHHFLFTVTNCFFLPFPDKIGNTILTVIFGSIFFYKLHFVAEKKKSNLHSKRMFWYFVHFCRLMHIGETENVMPLQNGPCMLPKAILKLS